MPKLLRKVIILISITFKTRKTKIIENISKKTIKLQQLDCNNLVY